MSEYLFTYGTLRQGLAPDCIAWAVDRLLPVGEGSMHGVLYDLGEYPGALPDALPESRIYGTVFRLPESALLARLDDYEGFQPDSPKSSLFLRQLHPVLLITGETVSCWVYVYNRLPGTSRVLANGRYEKKQLAKDAL